MIARYLLVIPLIAGAAAPALAASAEEELPALSAAEEGPSADEVSGAPLDPEDPAGTLEALWTALRGGQWLAAVGAGLVLLVWAARRLLALVWPTWASSKGGGYLISLGISAALTVGLELAVGTGLSWELALVALSAAWAAAGGLEAATDFGRWLLRKLGWGMS